MKKVLIIGGSILIIVLGVFFLIPKKPVYVPPVTPSPDTGIPVVVTPPTSTRQCFSYAHEATTTEPYATTEFLDMTTTGTTISGTKTGTEKGPDINTGYTGTITGTVDADMITAVFSYVIEGSKGQEKELYKIRP